MDDDRQSVELDLFVFGDDEVEVTDLGLGEAARRLLSFQAAGVLSPIENPASRFAADPLIVVQGLLDDARDHVEVPNFLDVTTLVSAVRADWPNPTNWSDALQQARGRFDRLWIGTHCDASLAKHPFNPHQSRRLSELFSVLQTLMEEMGESGKLSAKGQELHQQHFVGETAWFSDESEGHKQDPGRYTYPDPSGHGRLTCFWHGKIRSDYFRMHFEWPPANPRGQIRVVYVGPHR